MPKIASPKGLRVAYLNGRFPDALEKSPGRQAAQSFRVLYVVRGALLVRAHGAVADAVDGTLVFFPPGPGGDHRISGTAEAWLMSVDLRSADPWVRKEIAPLQSDHACCWHAILEAPQQARWESRFQYLESAGVRAGKEALAAALHDVRDAMSPEHGPEKRLGERVLRFVYEHFREDVSLASIAGAMGYSPAYLTDRVKRETGLPVHRWLLYYRIVEAKHLLRDTNLTIEQIAENAGFSSGNYFSRQFINATGQSPASWRALQRRLGKLPDSAHRFSSPHTPWGLQLSAVIDALPQLAWVKDANGALVFANKRWFDYSGLTEEESGGWGWTAIVHPDDVSSCVAEWRRALRSRTPVEYVVRIRRHADARYRAHLFRSVPYRADSGAMFWVGTATDLEDRLRANRPRAGSSRLPETSASA